MKIFKNTARFLFMALIVASCQKTELQPSGTESPSSQNSVNEKKSSFLENFEKGSKSSYTGGSVSLNTGNWYFDDALLGNTSSDHKHGLQAARLRNSGTVYMQFDKASGAGIVTVKHAKYGSDASTQWQLWYSTNSGSSYLQAGSTITTSSTSLQSATFTLNVSGNVRIEIKKTDGSSNRLNVDDISIADYSSGTNNPVPTISSISPDTAVAGGNSFTLTVNGTNFISSSAVRWNGTSLTTTFVSATQITASIPSADIATAGNAAVTAFNPSPGGGTSNSVAFVINSSSTVTGKRFLFDATKAETAGNADWVMDEDNSIPQRYPTPAQSTINSSTAETYWIGAISSWGIALVKMGNTVETLPASASITYGNSANSQDLSNYDVFVVDEPNIVFTSNEKTAILNFVQNGGGLFMVSDHTGSDRNSDGWDSPAIWNDLMTNNSIQNDPFGFSIDLSNISNISSNILSSSSNPVLHGSKGNVSTLEFDNGATITTEPLVNSNVQPLIWESSSSQNNSNVMCATSTFGTGRVFVVTDSSPIDDGTGAPGNTLYTGWSSYSHAALFLNASLWISKQ